MCVFYNRIVKERQPGTDSGHASITGTKDARDTATKNTPHKVQIWTGRTPKTMYAHDMDVFDCDDTNGSKCAAMSELIVAHKLDRWNDWSNERNGTVSGLTNCSKLAQMW